MRPSGLKGIGTNASGDTPAGFGGRGCGFVIFPSGDNPGAFPFRVDLDGCEKTSFVNVFGAVAFYFDEYFTALRIVGGTASSTYGYYIFSSPGEAVDMAAIVEKGSQVRDVDQAAVNSGTNGPPNVADGTLGMSLSQLKSFNATLSADAGSINAGVGYYGFWYWKDKVSRWVENVNQRQAPQGGQQDEPTADFDVGVDVSRVFVECHGMTVAAGANITPHLRGVIR